MPEPAAPTRVRYRFSPLERRGVIAGWRGGQIASVASGMVAAVLAVRSRPSIGGIAVALVCVGAAVALAFWPVHGRTGEQWLPLVLRWGWSRWSAGGVLLAPGPRMGHLTSVGFDRSGPVATPLRPATDVGPPGRPGGDRGGARTAGAARGVRGGVRGDGRARMVGGRGHPAAGGRRGRLAGAPPGPFDGLELVAAPFGPESSAASMGVVYDRRCRTATAVLVVRGHSFALLGPGDQDSKIAAWARFLATLAREGSEVHRVQWTESCLPDDGDALRRHWADHAVLGPESDAGRSYRSLLEESAPVARRHQVLVALSVSASRSSRAIRRSGGGLPGMATVLAREVLAVQHALEAADVPVEGVLGPRSLARVVGEAFAPARSASRWTDPGLGAARQPDDGTLECPDHASAPLGVALPPDTDGSGPWPWPMAVDPGWDAVRTDGTWHVTYWIAEWPRVDVTPDFLGPLLFSPLRRTITLTMEPVSPGKAARQVAQARTADIADGELRRRGGFLVTARHTRERIGVEERDVELADGHAQYRFTGYVTVTADSRDELVEACATVEQAAGHARVELRRLFGEQDVAFTCSLPLGRGLV